MIFFRMIALATALLFMTIPLPAVEWITADPSDHLNHLETELHTIFGVGEPGAGFRIGIPMMKMGLIPTINDSVALNLGLDILKWPKPDFGGVGAAVPVMLQWNFFLTQEWTGFAETGLSFQNWPRHEDQDDLRHFFLYPGLGVGIRYYLNEQGQYPALVLRLGYPNVFSLGVIF